MEEAVVRICTHCAHFLAHFGTDLHAHSVLSNKISASELSQKFIKSALLAGRYLSHTSLSLYPAPSPPSPPSHFPHLIRKAASTTCNGAGACSGFPGAGATRSTSSMTCPGGGHRRRTRRTSNSASKGCGSGRPRDGVPWRRWRT